MFKRLRFFFLLVFFVLAFNAFAQPANPDDPDEVPIGGIGLLVAAGAILGVKRLVDKRKE